MKRTILFLLLICCIYPSISAASDFNGFFVMDQIKNSVEIFDRTKRINTIKSAPKPSRIIKNPNNNGYILMNRGDKKNSGGLTFLNPDFKPATRKDLPGSVVQDFYLKKSGLWLLFTVSSDNDKPVSNLTCYDLKTEATNTISLNGPPAAYRFNDDRTQLAVGTLGNAKNKVPAELALIDLIQNEVRMFPVSANPGAIYQTTSGKIVVACGGFRNSQKYPSKALIERTDTAEFAKLHWIDTVTGETEVTQLGYSPLIIRQDQNYSDSFYAVCANVYGDPNEEQMGITIGNILNESNQPAATFFKITSGKISADLKLQNQPNLLVQPSFDTVCLQGKKELLIVDVSEPTPKVLEYKHDKDIDEFLYNNDGTIGYLSNSNSNYLNIIDLKAGKEIKIIKISDTFYIGKMFLNFFGSGYPPVIQSQPGATFKSVNSSENRRMFFSKDSSQLYILAGAPELSVIDLQTNEVKSVIKFKDTQYGIHPTPDGKLITVTTENGWHLLDPSKKEPLFSLNFQLEESEQGPEKGYYSPDENLLVIPFKNYLYLIDPIQGVSIGKTRTKAIAPLIAWPE